MPRSFSWPDALPARRGITYLKPLRESFTWFLRATLQEQKMIRGMISCMRTNWESWG